MSRELLILKHRRLISSANICAARGNLHALSHSELACEYLIKAQTILAEAELVEEELSRWDGVGTTIGTTILAATHHENEESDTLCHHCGDPAADGRTVCAVCYDIFHS